VFLAWTTGGSVVAQHLGPDGLGAGGWPDGSLRATPSAPASRIYFWPDLALGPGGGVFASWAAGSPYVADNGGMYVRRLTGAGDNSPGWPTEGMYLGSFPTDVALDFPQAPLLDISPDDRGGLLCIVGSVNGYVADVRLHRMLADGTTSPGWPDGGRVLPWYPDGYGYYEYAGPDDGLRVYPDGQDGVLVESLVTSVHSWDMGYSRCSDGGQWSMLMQDFPTGHEVVTKGDGGAFVASFKPAGPFNRYEPEAFLAVDQSYPPPGWTEWRETQTQAAVGWYGDIALAPAGDGGVVFFWSQHRERFGLFARKFTTAGQVTAVAPGPGAETGPLGLHGLRFVSGTGVVARVAGTCQRL